MTALRVTQEELCYDTDQLPTSKLNTVLGKTQGVPSMQGKKVPLLCLCDNEEVHSATEAMIGEVINKCRKVEGCIE